MNCDPCRKLGLSVVAHYQAGGGKPAQCYYHHFNMPLPKNLQDKIASGPKPEAKALEQHAGTNTPTKLRSEQPDLAGVPPFRAKHLAKAKRSRPVAIPPPAAAPADPDPQQDADHSPAKETPTMPLNTDSTRTCVHPECETHIRLSNKSGACAKHFHWAKKQRPRRGAKHPLLNKYKIASPPRKPIAKQNGSSAIATICVTESNLDAFWARLSLEEKADIFSQQLEVRG